MKNWKKLITLFASACLLAAMLPQLAFAADEVIIADDFESGLHQWTPNFNADTAGVLPTVEVVADPIAENAGNQVLKIQYAGEIQGNKGTFTPSNYRQIESGVFVIRYKFLARSGERFNQLGIGGPILRTGYGGIYYPDVNAASIPITRDVWQTYQTVFDFEAGTVTHYLGTGDSLGEPVRVDDMTIKYVRPRMDLNWMTANDQIYLDDICMYASDAPSVTASTPANGATEVSTSAPLSVTFNHFMDHTTLNDSTVALTDGAGTPVAVGVTARDTYNTTQLVVTPTEPLENETNYTLSINGAEDACGVALSATNIAFTTMEEMPFFAEAPVFSAVTFESEPVKTPVTAIQEGLIEASMTLTNGTDLPKDIILIGVLRKDGAAVDMAYLSRTMAPSSTDTASVGLSVPDSSYTIEVYLWDGLAGNNALSERYILSADGVSQDA